MKIYPSTPRAVIFFWLLSLSAPLRANTTVTPDKSLMEQLSLRILAFETLHPGATFTSWSQIAEMYDWKRENGSNVYKDGTDISDHYSVVPPAERDKFPKGELLVISAGPLPWPEALKSSWQNLPPEQMTEQMRRELPVILTSQRPIRYLIYRTAAPFREMVTERMYEDELQEIIAKTGLKIPVPVHYVPTPQQLIPKDYGLPSNPAYFDKWLAEHPEFHYVKSTRSTSAPIVEPVSSAPPPAPPAPVTAAAPRSFPLWTAGILVLAIAALGWRFLRRK
jgi:hypothetical protein